MQFGLCWSPNTSQMEQLEELARYLGGLKESGADYLEMGAGALTQKQTEFDTLRRALDSARLSVPCINSFIPGAYRLTGPDADHAKALDYCSGVFMRAKVMGVDVIVLGSSGARKRPDDFDQAQAESQFCDFCRALGPLADEAGIDIAIEPLNAAEDNLILSVKHGAALVDRIAHPRIRLLADLYHMSEEREPMQHVAEAGARLRHAHLADRGRIAPGTSAIEEDFDGFFRALRACGYAERPWARCSFEGPSKDILSESGPLLAFLRRRWQESLS